MSAVGDVKEAIQVALVVSSELDTEANAITKAISENEMGCNVMLGVHDKVKIIEEYLEFLAGFMSANRYSSDKELGVIATAVELEKTFARAAELYKSALDIYSEIANVLNNALSESEAFTTQLADLISD